MVFVVLIILNKITCDEYHSYSLGCILDLSSSKQNRSALSLNAEYKQKLRKRHLNIYLNTYLITN